MASAVLRRLVHAAISLVGISFVVFVLIRAAPGDPVLLHVGGVGARGVSPEVLAAMRAEMRLDEPVVVQYIAWLGSAVRLDFGDSFTMRRPVAGLVAEKLPGTLLLVASSLLIAIAIGLPLGMVNARFAGGRSDVASGIAATAIYSIPTFWLALLLLQLFAVRFSVLPLFGMPSEDMTPGARRILELARHMVLPVATLAAGQVAFLSRFVRASMLDSSGRDYMRTARAKGLSEWAAIRRHGLRNTISPLVSMLSVAVPVMLSACVVVERIFRWEGIGNLFVESVVARDYPVVMALTLLTAVLSLAAAALADVVQLAIDPRLRTGEEG
ncbi:MAG: ABC transporter permease [Thermoanaerobaculia bacterium]